MKKQFPDVIGIGAINYDYMFHVKKADIRNVSPDSGQESLDEEERRVEEEIWELSREKTPEIQVGGSALLALKAIHAIDGSLSLAYVSCCGQLNDIDRRNRKIDVRNELSYIDNQECWCYLWTNKRKSL